MGDPCRWRKSFEWSHSLCPTKDATVLNSGHRGLFLVALRFYDKAIMISIIHKAAIKNAGAAGKIRTVRQAAKHSVAVIEDRQETNEDNNT